MGHVLSIKRPNLICLLVFLLSFLTLTLVIRHIPQGLYSDPGWQLRALQQFLNHESPTFNHLLIPEASDLTKDSAVWIYIWPPSTQFLTLPLVRAGMTFAEAIRFIVLLCIFLGSLGWMRWLALFKLPLWIQIGMACLFPWIRYESRCLFWYAPEILVYAISPWSLLATWYFIQRRNLANLRIPSLCLSSILLGLFLGSGYIGKFSTILVSLGAVTYVGFCTLREKADAAQSARYWRKCSFLLVLIFFCLPILFYSSFSYRMHATVNLVVEKLSFHLEWQHILFLIANPLLSLAGFGDFLNYALLNPDNGFFAMHSIPIPRLTYAENSLWLGFLGLPGALYFFRLLLKDRPTERLHQLSLCVLLVGCAVMLCIWTMSRSFVDCSLEHFTCLSMAVFPLVSLGLVRASRRTNPFRTRLSAGVFFVACILVPFVYGPVSVVVKTARMPKHYQTGPSGFYNPLLAQYDIATVRKNLMSYCRGGDCVWYFPEPMTALDIPGRAIITHADFESLDDLRSVRFQASRPLEVYVLLPMYFEKGEKGRIIRGSFLQAADWRKFEIEGCQYYLWVATLQASASGVIK